MSPVSVAATGQNGKAESSLVNLNELLQVQVQKFLSDVSRKPVMLRCEALPFITGDGAMLLKAFNDLFILIFHDLPAGNKWYLHITCQEEERESTISSTGWAFYKIQFHANLKATAEWKTMACAKLQEMNAEWNRHKWSLKVDDVRYAGRLFSVSLPGKLI